MRTVWKYYWPLPANEAVFQMPGKAEILTAKEQGNDVCIWARVETSMPERDRRFALSGTGQEAPASGEYVGTAMLNGGALVLHIFELPDPNAWLDKVM